MIVPFAYLLFYLFLHYVGKGRDITVAMIWMQIFIFLTHLAVQDFSKSFQYLQYCLISSSISLVY